MKRLNPLVLAVRQLRREWRSGELAVLIAALIVAVGALSSIGFATDRVRQGVERRAAESLAGDLVIRSRNEIPREFDARAEAAGLATARVVDFPSVVTTAERGQLAEVRAVNDGYPLRGRLEVATQAYGEATPTDELPGPGEVWAEPRLVGALGIDVGDEVSLGGKRFRLTRVIDFAPDQGFSFVEIAPMLLVRHSELLDTSLLGPMSRLSHRLLIAGERGAVDRFRADIEDELGPGQRLLDIRDARPELASAVMRADRFLNLAALVAVVLAGVAIAMAARRYASRESDTVAILKCLGASRAEILSGYLAQLALIALTAGAAGIVVGYAAQYALLYLLRDILGTELPPASLAPVPWLLALAAIILGGFAVPPMLGLTRISPLRVLRRDAGNARLSTWLVYGIALAAVIAILVMQTRDLELSLYVMGGAAAGSALLGLGAASLVWLLNRLRHGVGTAWRFGVASIARRRRDSIVQVMSFGLGMLALLLLAVVRTDLIESWQAMLPDDAPNHFMINIQADEYDGVRAFFAERGVEPPRLSAMVRARLVEINGTSIEELSFDEPGRSQRFAEREQNLSWMPELPGSNTLVAGEWWSAEQHGAPLISLEEEAAMRLGAGLGDALTFDLAGERLTVTVASLRRVKWDSFEPNFFMVFPPGLLEDYPATFIGAVHMPEERSAEIIDLVRRYPSVTVIDLDAIITQVRSVMDQASAAVEYIFLFTLAAGVLVLLAAIQATRDERRFESAMLRTLGATRRTVLAGVIAEFTLLGLLAAVLAIATAMVAGWLLATEVFELDYRTSPHVWLIGLIAGTLFVGATGVLATRRVVRQPPLLTLRQR